MNLTCILRSSPYREVNTLPVGYESQSAAARSQYHYSTLFFIYTVVLPEGQKGEAWEPSKKLCFFGVSGNVGRIEVSRNLEVRVHLEGPASGQLAEGFSAIFLSWYQTPRCIARCSYPPKRSRSPNGTKVSS
jgi:hypothetical protein